MQLQVILLVENNPTDVLMVRRAFRYLSPVYLLMPVPDGGAAIQYVSGLLPYQDRKVFPFPRMVLLDLRMPNLDGFRFLEWARHEPSMKNVPVVVLTGSVYSEDVKRAYSLGAKSFIVKPPDPDQLLKELELALSYWAPVAPHAKAA